MKLRGIIVDADFCIKVGASPKYRYLEKVLMELSDKIYIHKAVYDEIMVPACAKEQIDSLIQSGVLEVLDEEKLESVEKIVYESTYQSLAAVMIHPGKPIDRILNTGVDNIICVRIEDVIQKIKNNEIRGFKRKEAKVLWRLAGKRTDVFDKSIWPIE